METLKEILERNKALSYRFPDEDIREISEYFKIDLWSLPFIQFGGYGMVLQIDNRSIIKVTTSNKEVEAIKELTDVGLNTHPGCATIIKDDVFVTSTEDTFYTDTYKKWAYREELLITDNYERKTFENALGTYRQYRGESDFFCIDRFINDMRNLKEEEYWEEAYEREQEFIEHFNNPALANIADLVVKAVSKDIYLRDIRIANVGFRVDPETGRAYEEAGLVLFDWMLI